MGHFFIDNGGNLGDDFENYHIAVSSAAPIRMKITMSVVYSFLFCRRTTGNKQKVDYI